MTARRPPVEGVVALIERSGTYLVIQRASGIALGGCWCFPGGAVEPGESQAEAVRREIREEVGLQVQPIRRLWSWTRPDGGLILHWWAADFVTGALSANPAEVQATAWLMPSEIRILPDLLPGNLEFLDHYFPAGIR